mgnify:CR=1 FL=1
MEKTKMDEIVTAMTEHVCDKLCLYPQEIKDTEELDRQCGGCQMSDYLCGILNEYNRINNFEQSQCAKLLKDLSEERQKHRWIPVSEDLPEEPESSVLDMDDLEEYIVMISGAVLPTSLG